jgi:lysozyme
MRKNSLFIALIAVIAIFAFSAFDASAVRAAGTYTVLPGDTLFSIAARFNVSISQLATINKVYDVNALNAGQVLQLPDPLPTGGAVTSPVVNTGNFGTGGPVYAPVYTAPIYTPAVVTYPAGTTVTTVTTYTAYTVRPGDFLAAIAQRFNTTNDAILSANSIFDPNLLYVGQLLTIPRTRTSISPKPRTVVAFPTFGVGGANRLYIVQPGDNLFGIAARTGRNAYTIAQANGILDLNTVYVGQPLVLP